VARRDNLLLIAGAAVALALTAGGIAIMADWKKRALLLVGQSQYDYLMGLFNAASAQYGLPPDLLAAQAWQESNWNPTAQSGVGAQGIMQLMPQYYPNVDPFDPTQAIPAAAATDAANYQRFGSWALALAAYNAGAGNVDKYGGIPPFTETQNYVANILSNVNAGIAPGGTQVA
jgi:soluble lytic murein transglycosylase-like protein